MFVMDLAPLAVFIASIALASAKLQKIKIQDGHNPGKCNETSHGTFTIVKDRKNNDKLLFCAEENSSYLWKITDGSNPTGEFFSPAYDCSDILDKNADAKDGYYWVNLVTNVPRKVWCDMTTDGGGFMLIGRKTDPVTWTVPSNNRPVAPFGKPHWCSSLGDAPILDFRVQVATQEDFSATRAHWSFKLHEKRPLKNLLIVGKGGCGSISPGIGDIADVKDLLTNKIVSTTFRCSHFGKYHPKSSGFGWDMMNFCLNHPCPRGFAFHHKYPIQTDFSGAFSYSASAKMSGITHDSTSFVGCDKEKCCGCFGPRGGMKNYCGIKCTAKNGGTITKNVYTWFWVRSSLPKIVWNKCMEYKVTTAKGRVVWYRLNEGNAIPVIGRCNQNEALLNGGIVVVSDSDAAKKIPPVPGLLEYRKDNQKLYFMSNKTWNVIAEDKKITKQRSKDFAQLKNTLDKLEVQLGNLKKDVKKNTCQYNPLGMQDGRIQDSQITASSQWDYNHRPPNARLFFRAHSGRSGAWSTRHNTRYQWIQVDFRKPATVRAIKTQGREDCCNQFVRSYTMSWSNDGTIFYQYKQKGNVKVFVGNSDRQSVVEQYVSPPIVARYIRVNPQSWNEHISLRLEFIGCY